MSEKLSISTVGNTCKIPVVIQARSQNDTVFDDNDLQYLKQTFKFLFLNTKEH